MIVKAGLQRRALVVALAGIYGMGAELAQANPIGAQVVNGQAVIQSQGQRLTVTNTPGAIINWQSFNIGAGETTYFQQQSAASAVLNRVQAQNPNLRSQIDGTLGSNGRVFLINPNGMVFGAGSVIDTQGFVASTLHISDEDFRSGKMKFTSQAAAGGIQAKGTISSGNGDVYLVAPKIGVDGNAVITSSGGNVVLAAGEMVEITGRNLNDITFQVQSPDNQAINLGTLSGGAVGVFAGTLSHSGIIRAHSLALEGGQLVLKAQRNLTLAPGSRTIADGQTLGGSIRIESELGNVAVDTGAIVSAQGSASVAASRGGEVDLRAASGYVAVEHDALVDAGGGQGGSVRIEAAKLVQDGSIRADGHATSGGTVTLQLDSRVIQSGSALVSARGVTRGGNITVSVDTDPDSSGHLFTSGTLDASALGGVGGGVTITGRELVLAGAHVLANGDSGGGTLRIGGGRAGTDSTVDNAQNLVANAASRFEANARVNGDGGTVVAWADGSNQFAGRLEARGGASAGNGGFIEVSGKRETQFGGTPDASAPHGSPGTFLLDPYYVLIQAPVFIEGVSIELLDPNPGSGNFFGQSLTTVVGGNILVFNQRDDFAGADSGAIYLYNGTTGALMSNLRGSQAGDQIGSSGVLRTLGNGSLLLSSPSWNSGAGALTTFNPVTGLSGTISSANSLVGSSAGDGIGSSSGGGGVQNLLNGKFAVRSPLWNNGALADAGAITWVDATSGTTGVVSSANSLVGDAAGDMVGNAALQQVSSKYTLASSSWHAASGAVTWIDSAAPLVGPINSGNSLVGASPGDAIGSGGVYNLFTGKSLVFSPLWSGGKGAVTWFDQSAGTTGVVSSSNSLVGATSGDQVGSGFWDTFGGTGIAILSPQWSNVTETAAGAVTWANSGTAMTGVVSGTNSLVGSLANDRVGSGGIGFLDGMHYTVLSPSWNANAGAVSWFDSASPPVGAVSNANSLVGNSANDAVGSGGLYDIGGGKTLVFSPNWGGTKGAVTWLDQAAGTFGDVSAANSLVGAVAGDFVGSGNYDFVGSGIAIFSPNWRFGGSVANAGAITWAPIGGMTGVVADTNSLVGGNSGDLIGNNGLEYLDGIHYAVRTPGWNGTRGAVTWVDSGAPVVGAIGTTNSLTGASVGDSIGSAGFDSVGAGKYIVRSPGWNGNMGAVTWFDIALGTSGTVTLVNSLVGSTAGTTSTGDRVGSAYQLLDNDMVALRSPNWNNVAATGAGAITFADAGTGITGAVSSLNSLVGTNMNDRVGNNSLVNLGGGKYYAYTPAWGLNAGALTWIDSAAAPLTGALNAGNSLLGATAGDRVGSGGIVNLFNGKRMVFSPNWDSSKGAVTWFDDSMGTFGLVGAGNSLVGSTANDSVGGFGSYGFVGSQLVIFSSAWNNGGSVAGAGALTWADPLAGISGPVSAANSLVGTTANDAVGSTGLTYTDGTHYLVQTPNWNGNMGAVTWVDSNAPLVGAITSANSLVGASAADRIGSGGVYNLGSGKSLVFSPGWNTNRGAVTAFNNTSGTFGVVDSSNSLVGTTSGDMVGNGFWDNFGSKLAINSPDWNNGGSSAAAGAITWVDLAAGFSGAVTASNSLVGTQANDRVGNGSLQNLSGSLWAVTTTSWNGNAGAVTWINQASPLTGAVGSANSLVGSSAGDFVGLNGFSTSFSGMYSVLRSTNWNGSRGAATWIDYAAPATGAVSSANSLVGASANDRIGNSGVSFLSNGSYYVLSSSFGSNAGAVSVGAASGGISGVVSGANSLVGQVASDGYAGFVTQITGSRLLVRASNADSNGLTNNGRIHIYSGGPGGGGGPGGALGSQGFGDNAGASVTITPGQITAITNSGTNVVLEANSDIMLALLSDIITQAGGNGGDLTLRAGRSVLINSSIVTDGGNLTIIGNERVSNGVQAAYRDPGVAEINMADGTRLNAGTGNVTVQLRDGAGHSGAMASADSTGLHKVKLRSIAADRLSVATDFGGIQIGDLDATLPSDIIITQDVHLAANTGILLAGGGGGAFAQLAFGTEISNDAVNPSISTVPAPLDLRNGGSYARIVNPPQTFALNLQALNCFSCVQLSPYLVTGADSGLIDTVTASLLSLNPNLLDQIDKNEKSKGEIEIEVEESCK